MAVKVSDLTTESAPASTDILLIADPTTGVAKKITVSALKTYMDGLGGGADTTAPVIVSATATTASTITLVFSESVTVTTAGWSFKKNGVDWPISSVSGSGATWTFTMSTSGTSSDTLLRSYNSTTGATVDTSANELVTFTDQSVTNSIPGGGFAGTPLTWSTIASDHEQWNSSLGIRRKSTEANDWENESSNVSVSNQTIGTGERVVFTIASLTNALVIGLNSNSSPQNVVFGASTFGITTDSGGGTGLIQGFEGSSATGSTRAGSTSEYYAIFYDGSNIRYQYSTDGVSWTTFQTSAGTPSGTYRVHFQAYHSNFGPNGIYKV